MTRNALRGTVIYMNTNHTAVIRAAKIVTSFDRSLWAAKLTGLAERWPNLAIATALYIAEAEG